MGCNGSKASAPAAGSVANAKASSGEQVAQTLLEKRSAGAAASSEKKAETVEVEDQEILLSVLLPEHVQVITSDDAPNGEQQSPGEEAPGAIPSEGHGSAPESHAEGAGLDISRERVARDAQAAAEKEEPQVGDLPKIWLPVNAITGLASHIGNIEAIGGDVVLSRSTEKPSSILASSSAPFGLCSNPCCGEAVDVNEETVVIPTEIGA